MHWQQLAYGYVAVAVFVYFWCESWFVSALWFPFLLRIIFEILTGRVDVKDVEL